MEIRLNGETRRYEGPMTIRGLLASLGLSSGGVVVEVNRRICPRERWAEDAIREGDAIEVIRLVGGG